MLRRFVLGFAVLGALATAEAAQAQFSIGIGVGGYRGGGVGVYYGNYSRYGYGYPGYYGYRSYGYPGYYGYGYPGYYGGSGVSVYVRPRTVYYAPAYVQPAQYQQAAPGPQPVYVNVTVPADAEVWFDGNKTTQTGGVRRFVSPPLPPGQNYSYEVTASYMKDGKPVTEKRTLNFVSGEQTALNVDLRPGP